MKRKYFQKQYLYKIDKVDNDGNVILTRFYKNSKELSSYFTCTSRTIFNIMGKYDGKFNKRSKYYNLYKNYRFYKCKINIYELATDPTINVQFKDQGRIAEVVFDNGFKLSQSQQR